MTYHCHGQQPATKKYTIGRERYHHLRNSRLSQAHSAVYNPRVSRTCTHCDAFRARSQRRVPRLRLRSPERKTSLGTYDANTARALWFESNVARPICMMRAVNHKRNVFGRRSSRVYLACRKDVPAAVPIEWHRGLIARTNSGLCACAPAYEHPGFCIPARVRSHRSITHGIFAGRKQG